MQSLEHLQQNVAAAVGSSRYFASRGRPARASISLRWSTAPPLRLSAHEMQVLVFTKGILLPQIRVDESGEGLDRLEAVEYTTEGYGVAVNIDAELRGDPGDEDPIAKSTERLRAALRVLVSRLGDEVGAAGLWLTIGAGSMLAANVIILPPILGRVDP